MTTKLEQLRTDLHAHIDAMAFEATAYMRIITDKKVPFPQNYQWIGHDRHIELSSQRWHEHPNKGWGNPDVEFLGVELFYLHK